MKNPFAARLADGGFVVLDGGLGTELERHGHLQLGKLWSAGLVRTRPDAIRDVHRDYLEAGANVICTATFQAAVPTIRQTGLHRAEAEDLLLEAVSLAVMERDCFAEQLQLGDDECPLVAASIGPYGASLCNRAEYTGAYDVSEKQLISFHLERWGILADTDVDVMACETIPSIAEVHALLQLISAKPHKPAWMSFLCRDAEHLADGTPLSEALQATQGVPNLCAVGVNCVPPSLVTPTLAVLSAYSPLPLMVYPNASESWSSSARVPGNEISPEEIGQLALEWMAAGAQIIGGCCRTGPEHVRAIAETLIVAR